MHKADLLSVAPPTGGPKLVDTQWMTLCMKTSLGGESVPRHLKRQWCYRVTKQLQALEENATGAPVVVTLFWLQCRIKRCCT